MFHPQVFHPTTGNLLYQLSDETMPRYPVVSMRFKRAENENSVKNILLATCECYIWYDYICDQAWENQPVPSSSEKLFSDTDWRALIR